MEKKIIENNRNTAILTLQVLDVPLANPYLPGSMRRQICDEHGFTATECASGKIDPGNSHAPINGRGIQSISKFQGD